MERSPAHPHLDTAGSRKVEAWFLGPKGENADILERLIVEAVRDQVYWRRNYHPDDPTHITEEIKRSPEYLQAMDALQDGYRGLLAFLKKSVPFFSMRYQGHMNWDLTMPSILGYFAAMLYNPNNVAFEGSTATTLLELLVGDDLCQMLGYRLPTPQEMDHGAMRPWGHITCDGTVANIEALWAARNLKFYPLACREALATETVLAAAKHLHIPLPTGGEARLIDLTPLQLLNLAPDHILQLPIRLATEFGIARDAITSAIGKYALPNMGLLSFSRKFLGSLQYDPVVCVPGTKHYSFPKAVAVLGLGADNLINVAVDLDARMDLDDLRRHLDRCLVTQRPVIAVVAVLGTTEESAMDPLAQIVELRAQYATQGLVFHLHADAAWGGYHRSVINTDFALPLPTGLRAAPIAAPLSDYAVQQFMALGEADSITVDPHKSGYIPYPAGALCYRNASMRDLVTFSAPVVFHGAAEPTVGIYGIEGSKPGAAAAAVYLSHRVIRPTQDGYGKIIGQALFSCRKLYARLLTMGQPTDPFVVVPVPRLPAERHGGDAEAEKARVYALIDQKSSDEIQADPAATALLREIGPDQNILSYAFNLRHADGTINTDLRVANALNKALYEHLSINPGQDIYGYDLIVSTTDLDMATYGAAFIEAFKRRLGVAGSPGGVMTVLRSVVMDPWVTETSHGSFLDVLEREFRRAVSAALEQLHPSQMRGY
jgi:glutamate/tyrosine decarboxylase-like PLP-dependent enzyme